MDKDTLMEMDSAQQSWYAKAMISTIMADGRIDEAEEAYLTTVFNLFKDAPQALAQLKHITFAGEPLELEEVNFFSPELARIILQDCMSIAIADAEFHPKERQAIKRIGKCLHLADHEIETAIQRGYEQLAHIFTFAS